MDPVQIYETTIYNRDRRGEHFSFATVSARSIRSGEVPSVDTLAQTLGVLFMRESPRAFRRNLRAVGSALSDRRRARSSTIIPHLL
jgi:hypothetical protein